VPYHTHNATLAPFGRADPYADMMPLVAKMIDRIRNNRHNRGMGTLVLACERGGVYAIREGARGSDALLRHHPGWLVGIYAAGPLDGDYRTRANIIPTRKQLFQDLVEHFVGNGFVTPEMVMEFTVEGME